MFSEWCAAAGRKQQTREPTRAAVAEAASPNIERNTTADRNGVVHVHLVSVCAVRADFQRYIVATYYSSDSGTPAGDDGAEVQAEAEAAAAAAAGPAASSSSASPEPLPMAVFRFMFPRMRPSRALTQSCVSHQSAVPADDPHAAWSAFRTALRTLGDAINAAPVETRASCKFRLAAAPADDGIEVLCLHDYDKQSQRRDVDSSQKRSKNNVNDTTTTTTTTNNNNGFLPRSLPERSSVGLGSGTCVIL